LLPQPKFHLPPRSTLSPLSLSDQHLRPTEKPSEMARQALCTLPDLSLKPFPPNRNPPSDNLQPHSKRCITDVFSSDVLRIISSYAASATHREYTVLAPYPILAQHTAIASDMENCFTAESEVVGDGMFKHIITFGYGNAAVSWKQLEAAFPGITYTESVQLPRIARSWDHLQQANQHITIQFRSVAKCTQQIKDVVVISIVHYDKVEAFVSRGLFAPPSLSLAWDDAGGFLSVTSSYRITDAKEPYVTHHVPRMSSDPPPLFMHVFPLRPPTMCSTAECVDGRWVPQETEIDMDDMERF